MTKAKESDPLATLDNLQKQADIALTALKQEKEKAERALEKLCTKISETEDEHHREFEKMVRAFLCSDISTGDRYLDYVIARTSSARVPSVYYLRHQAKILAAFDADLRANIGELVIAYHSGYNYCEEFKLLGIVHGGLEFDVDNYAYSGHQTSPSCTLDLGKRYITFSNKNSWEAQPIENLRVHASNPHIDGCPSARDDGSYWIGTKLDELLNGSEELEGKRRLWLNGYMGTPFALGPALREQASKLPQKELRAIAAALRVKAKELLPLAA